MFGLFAPLARLFDHGLDGALEKASGKGLGKVMGVIGTIMAASLVVATCAALLLSAGTQIRPPVYYAVLPGEPPARLRVLDGPALSVDKITNWSARAVRDIFRFNFRDIDARLRASSAYFTPAAYRDFMRAMENSGTIQDVKDQRQFVLLTPMEPAQLVDRATVNGNMVLRVEIPVLLTYIAGEKPVYQKQYLVLFVMPVPTTEDPEGLAIARLEAHPYR